MSRYDWLLFLHLIGAFAAMGSVVVFSVLLLAGDRVAGAQLTFLGRRLWDVGGLEAMPREYERRVVGFFDEALLE